jgi:hypothetical protein
VDCLAGAVDRPAPPGARSLAFFADGACAAGDADEGTRGCRPGARLRRPPHLALGDRAAGALRVVEVPAGCTPARVFAGAGAQLLACALGEHDERARLRFVDAAGRFTTEADVGVPADRLGPLLAAPDGTLVLGVRCAPGTDCVALVRRPLAIGAGGAWREVRVPGARALGPLAGGRAIVLGRAGGAPTRLQVSIAGPDGEVSAAAPPAPVAGSLIGFRVVGGRLELADTTGTWRQLQADGSLLPPGDSP